MDARFINPFIKSVCNTVGTMCDLKVTVGKPQLKRADEEGTDVSAIIGFSGDAAGSVAVRFDFAVASSIATAFAKTEITPEHEDFTDALGELANMVAGGAKAQFQGLDISISLPSVVIGKNHTVPNSKSAPRLIIPCSTTVGTFLVEVGMVMTHTDSAQSTVATAGATA